MLETTSKGGTGRIAENLPRNKNTVHGEKISHITHESSPFMGLSWYLSPCTCPLTHIEGFCVNESNARKAKSISSWSKASNPVTDEPA